MEASVRRLWRYPVKSLRGEACDALALDARGVEGDRVFAVRADGGKLGSGKSTRRFCRIDGLLDLRAELDGEVPVVVLADGSRCRGDDPALPEALTAHLGQPVTLAREASVSHLDAGPVHLLTTASLAWLGVGANEAVRFRPNVLIDAVGADRVEDAWIGRRLGIGAQVELEVTERAERCRMVTLAQSDLSSAPRVLARIAREAGARFGVYARVLTAGRIAAGDPVVVRDES